MLAFCNKIMTWASAAGLSAALALESLNELFERKILVGEGRERCRTNPTHHLPRTGVATEIGAENHRVDQRADEALGPRTIAIGDVRGHSHVVLTRVAMQQRLQGGDERHEQRAAFSMAEAFGGLRQARRQRHLPPRRAEIVDCPSRDGPWQASSRAADREAALASMRAAQRSPDVTASAAASAQSPRTGSRAAPGAMSCPAENAS